jgi:uncharacterized lipoprotein YddW (UPF0748 family)
MTGNPIPSRPKLVKPMSGTKIIVSLLLPSFIIFFSTFSYASSTQGPAAWVIRWHMDSPTEIKEICKEAKGSFSNLLVQVRGRADAYYESDIAPRAEELKEQPINFDPLALILDQCNSQTLHAWLNVYYLWTGKEFPEDPLHPAQQHNNWIVNDNNGRSVFDYSLLEQSQGWIEGVYADPASLSYRSYFGKVIQELIEKYDVKGIHLDFIRYPGLAYGYDNRLTLDFIQQWGFDPRWLPDTISENDFLSWLDGSIPQEQRILTTGTLIWAAMRAKEVTSMMRVIRTIINSSNNDIVLSAAIFPDQLAAFLTKGQDWQLWAQENLIDQLYPMAYFGETARINKQLHSVAKSLQGTNISLYAGLGAYIKDPQEIEEESRSASMLHYDGIALFSLGHLKNKINWSKPYVEAIKKHFQDKKTPPSSTPLLTKITLDNRPKDILSSIRNLHNIVIPMGEHQQVIIARKMEFIDASKTAIPTIIKKMKNNPGNIPAWLDKRGIFRYVHPYDSNEKIIKQEETCSNAREMIIKGKKPFVVAKKYSQAGARNFGALLPRYYISTDNRIDRQLVNLQPGDVSEVIRQDDGFWVYQIIKKGQKELKPFAEIPWPARRVMLRKELANYQSNKK